MEHGKTIHTWEECVAFHGHSCPGLTIGYKAALYAIRLLDLSFSEDEEVVCISENDACCVDAIQIMLGCTAGKGNLLFHMTGKMAFTFLNRETGKSVRILLKPQPSGETRNEKFDRMQAVDPADLFEIKPVKIQYPEKAQLFGNFTCECCGESTAESFIRIQGGKKVCIDCYKPYSRFQV